MRKIFSTLIVLFTLALAGCATDGGMYRPNQAYGVQTYNQPNYNQGNQQYRQPYQSNQYGQTYAIVYSVERVPVNVSNGTNGIGAIGGAVVGGAAANQIGKGSGKKIATILGVVGGAMAGNEFERRGNNQVVQGVRLQVRLDNGQMMTIVQQQDYGFQSGTRVRLIQQSDGNWIASNS